MRKISLAAVRWAMDGDFGLKMESVGFMKPPREEVTIRDAEASYNIAVNEGREDHPYGHGVV